MACRPWYVTCTTARPSSGTLPEGGSDGPASGILIYEQKRESDLVEVCDGSDIVGQDSPVVIKVADIAMHSHIHARSPLRNALRHLFAVCIHRPQQLA